MRGRSREEPNLRISVLKNQHKQNMPASRPTHDAIESVIADQQEYPADVLAAKEAEREKKRKGDIRGLAISGTTLIIAGAVLAGLIAGGVATMGILPAVAIITVGVALLVGAAVRSEMKIIEPIKNFFKKIGDKIRPKINENNNENEVEFKAGLRHNESLKETIRSSLRNSISALEKKGPSNVTSVTKYVINAAKSALIYSRDPAIFFENIEKGHEFLFLNTTINEKDVRQAIQQGIHDFKQFIDEGKMDNETLDQSDIEKAKEIIQHFQEKYQISPPDAKRTTSYGDFMALDQVERVDKNQPEQPLMQKITANTRQIVARGEAQASKGKEEINPEPSRTTSLSMKN